MKIEIVITAGVVAVVSAIFSFVCMIISWSQARDSRKNLKMQTELFEARRPNFRIKDILDSYALTELESQFVNIKMCSLITNLSDKPLTIEKVRLYVVGEEQTVILLPVMAENCVIDGFNIPANNAATQWIHFNIDRQLYRDLKIMKFVLVIEDVYGNKDERTVICLKEIINEYE